MPPPCSCEPANLQMEVYVLVETIVQALIQLKAQGLSLLVVEQNKVHAERADRVITLVAGQLQL